MPTPKRNTSDTFENRIFFSDSRDMKELPKESVHLIITSPPYYNVKNYALDGYQRLKTNTKSRAQIGDIKDYDEYIKEMLVVWKECTKVLKPNGKLIINTPLMPIPKASYNGHHTRHIFNIASDIENSILRKNKKHLPLRCLYLEQNKSEKGVNVWQLSLSKKFLCPKHH